MALCIRASLPALALGLLLLLPGGARATVISGQSSAFGLFVDLEIPILPDLFIPETPSVAGTAPTPYDLSDASISFDGTFVDLGLLEVAAASNVDGGPGIRFAEASAGLKSLSVEFPSVFSLEFSALGAEARSEGDFGALSSSGGGLLASLRLEIAGNVVFDGAINPDPNTQILPGLLGPLGIELVLNEQTIFGDGVGTTGIAVNALHLVIDKHHLSGEIIFSHAESHLVAVVPEPGTLLLLTLAGLALALATARLRRRAEPRAGPRRPPLR